MSGAVLNSLFLTTLLTSDEEDIERVSMLKQDISSTSVTFNATYLTVTSLQCSVRTLCSQSLISCDATFHI